MGAISIEKGFYDEGWQPPAERGSEEDLRRSLVQLNRRISIGMNRLGRQEALSRVTSATTLDTTYRHVFVNTDSAAVTITLPAGVQGTYYRIVNTGTSSNNVTITPNGTDNLIGVNSSFTLLDTEALIILFDDTDGWM